jgi:hypothetical protein
MKCAKTLLKNVMEPIYFFSDSNDLVQYMAFDIKNSTSSLRKLDTTQTLDRNAIFESDAIQVASRVNIVARSDVSFMDNVHIDKQKGRDPPAYYATFVDLFIAIYARCITYGVGNYALLAMKISGTSCRLLYAEETWGNNNERKGLNTKLCVLG